MPSLQERYFSLFKNQKPIEVSEIATVDDAARYIIENQRLISLYDRIYYPRDICFVQVSKERLKMIVQAAVDSLKGVPELSFKSFSSSQILNSIKFMLDTNTKYGRYPTERDGYIHFENGVFSLRDCVTYYTPVGAPGGVPTYYIKASVPANPSVTPKPEEMPCMHSFLQTITKGDQILISRIWEMLGYLLYENIAGKTVFILQGKTNAGKSVLGRLVSDLLSVNSVRFLDIEQLNQRNATSELVGVRLNMSMDLPNRVLPARAIENIKLLTGNDSIEVFYRNGSYQRYTGSCKFLFATNHCITMKGSDPGFLSRVVCIPFNHEIEKADQELNLFSNLWEERHVIVKMALVYYISLRKCGYVFSGSDNSKYDLKVRYMQTEVENREEIVRQFVEDCCILTDKMIGRTYTQSLYSAYLTYCKENGFTPIDTPSGFSRMLAKAYSGEIEQGRWRECQENQHGFKGIMLRANI